MDIASLTATNSQVETNSTSAFSQLTSDFDTFLTLLTTQLQNQDPLEPLDTEQFTQQLVQFAGVEQSIQTNTNLETLIALQSNSDRQTSIDLVGRIVSVTGNEVTLSNDSSLPVRWQYSLPQNAATLTLNVTDASGRSIATLSGPNTSGRHDLVWDGRTSTGERAAPGIYSLSATATDAQGNTIPTSIGNRGFVESVVFNETNSVVVINGREIPLSDITRVDAQF